jgi:hypothetical protein
MHVASYNVIFQGLTDGCPPQKVRDNLAALFKISPQKFDPLFQGKPIVLKRGVSHDTAVKYKAAFEKAGTQCQIKPSARKHATKGDTNLGLYENPISCPKCGLHQEKTDTCQACGVIFAKITQKKPPDNGHHEKAEEQTSSDEKMREAPEKKSFLGAHKGLVSTLLVVIFAALGFLEMVYLKGEQTAQGSIRIGDQNASLAIHVKTADQKHFVRIYTNKKRTLKYQVLGPDDTIAYSNTELAKRKGYRSFTFHPKEAGTYRLFVDPGVFALGTWGNAKATVYVNDRRILTRVSGWLQI